MERFETSVRYHPWYEHWHRYYFVKNVIKDKVVADIACGEGYGSALLSQSAKSIVGVDVDKDTIKRANQKYNSPNLSYITANALQTPFDDATFDVVISFETLEHLSEHGTLLSEFLRILKKDGILIISTPDKEVYSDIDNHNHFHVKELTSFEFDQLIESRFKYQQTFGQQLQLSSIIQQHDKNEDKIFNQIYLKTNNEFTQTTNQTKPTYLIKICSNSEKAINNINTMQSHFCDANNSLMKHFEEQIQRLLMIDKQNHKLKEMVEQQHSVIDHLKARLGI